MFEIQDFLMFNVLMLFITIILILICNDKISKRISEFKMNYKQALFLLSIVSFIVSIILFIKLPCDIRFNLASYLIDCLWGLFLFIFSTVFSLSLTIGISLIIFLVLICFQIVYDDLGEK